MSRFNTAGLVMAASLLAAPAVASAAPIVIGSTTYNQSGTTELVNAPFTLADAGVSLNSYNGLVQVKVWGTGESANTRLNDAFYVFADLAHNPITPYSQGSYYALAFGTGPLVPLGPTQQIGNFIVYDVDAGSAVSPFYLPGYRTDHTYTFVINTGLLSSGQLHFGVSDGIFADNAGAYNIELTQLQPVPVPVPEPGSLLLLGTGLVFGASRLRKRWAAGRPRA